MKESEGDGILIIISTNVSSIRPYENSQSLLCPRCLQETNFDICIIIIIVIIIKDIYIVQVRRSQKCAMLAEMAVW